MNKIDAAPVVFLSRGGVTVIKSSGGRDLLDAVVDAARGLDLLPTTWKLGPVRLVVRDARERFDATWEAPRHLGALDVVRRGYAARRVVHVDGRLTAPVRTLVDRIADFLFQTGGSPS